MRWFARLYLLFVVLTLTAGPLLAAPVSLRTTPGLSAPSTGPSSVRLTAAKLAVYGLALFGAIKVKDTGAISKKFVQRAAGAAPDYAAGVANAGGDWETGAKNGETNFEQGVTEAIAQKRYGKGVSGSASKYQANASKLGAQRYPSGVQNAEQAYATGVQPYLDKLKSLTLPPKGPRRSPQNQQRANMVAAELGKLKTGM